MSVHTLMSVHISISKYTLCDRAVNRFPRYFVAMCVSAPSILASIIHDATSKDGNCPGVLPYKGLMGTCGQPGIIFRDFCLKQGVKFIIFCLNQGIDLSIFVLNRMSFLGR